MLLYILYSYEKIFLSTAAPSIKPSFQPLKSSLKEECHPALSAMQSLLQGPMATTKTTSIEQSPELFDSDTLRRPPLYTAARMLSYDSEDPLTEGHKQQEASGSLEISDRAAALPPRAMESRPVCLLTDVDPNIGADSASMVAFALSTPTKDDPTDFHRALENCQ